MIDANEKPLGLPERLEVASHFKAGFELDAEDVRFIHKSLTELRKKTITSVSAEEVYYEKKLEVLKKDQDLQRKLLHGVIAVNVWVIMLGIAIWSM